MAQRIGLRKLAAFVRNHAVPERVTLSELLDDSFMRARTKYGTFSELVEASGIDATTAFNADENIKSREVLDGPEFTAFLQENTKPEWGGV